MPLKRCSGPHSQDEYIFSDASGWLPISPISRCNHRISAFTRYRSVTVPLISILQQDTGVLTFYSTSRIISPPATQLNHKSNHQHKLNRNHALHQHPIPPNPHPLPHSLSPRPRLHHHPHRPPTRSPIRLPLRRPNPLQPRLRHLRQHPRRTPSRRHRPNSRMQPLALQGLRLRGPGRILRAVLHGR